MREVYVNLRGFLRAQASDKFRDSLSRCELRGGALRAACLESKKERYRQLQILNDASAVVQKVAPKPSEVMLRAAYAKRRRRLGKHWRTGALRRSYMLLRGQRGTAKEQQQCVSLCAWAFALAGMMICMGFLIAEFINSRESPALVSRIVLADSLQLPVVTFCSVIGGLPSFATYPEGNYSGRAIFGVRTLTDRSTNSSLWWPNTHLSGRVRTTYLGPSSCKEELSTFSFEHITHSRYMGRGSGQRECLPCFQLGWDPVIHIPRHNASISNMVSVELSLMREFAFCVIPQLSHLNYLRREIITAIKNEGQNLVASRILELEGTDDVSFALDNSFDELRRAGREDDTAYNIALGSFACNVYFASGHFYPKPSNVDVRYRFDAETSSWNEVGSGPYHPLRPVQRGTDLPGMRYEVDLARTLLVFARDKALGPTPVHSDNVGVLQELRSTRMLFRKIVDVADVDYNAYRPLATQFFQIVRERFYLFEASLDFEQFRVEVKSREPAISVSELVNDMFQYGAMFTGVCVYSILVGPAKWYLKRNAARREAQQMTGTTP